MIIETRKRKMFASFLFPRLMPYYSKYSDYWPKIVDESIKEPIEALNKAGLIRDDIKPKHFGIGYLYCRILRRPAGAFC